MNAPHEAREIHGRPIWLFRIELGGHLFGGVLG
jgi:hypothetical protein